MTLAIDQICRGDCLDVMRSFPEKSINCCVTSPPYYGSKRLLSMADISHHMARDCKGRFVKGTRNSHETEFKKGCHWREPKLYWDKFWLINEYVSKGRSSQEIASDFGCKDSNILYFLRKHKIPIRTITESREIKKWGLSGAVNGMYGRNDKENPHWKGGITPDRQALYSSPGWSEAVKAVWSRDKACCRRCGKLKDAHDEYHIHHITTFARKELRCDLSNLVLLCKTCHHFVHSKKNVEMEFCNVH